MSKVAQNAYNLLADLAKHFILSSIRGEERIDMQIIWLGHGSFRIEIEDKILLIDP